MNEMKGGLDMRFLYFGDLHERATSPENRKDDFRQTVDDKISEIQKLGIKHKVKAFLQPGDFLDEPKHDSAFLSEVVNRWGFSDVQEDILGIATGKVDIKDVSEKIKKHIPIIGAIGNHELFGNALKSYPKTSLAFLEKIGFMHFPTKEKPFIFKDESGFTVAITASHYDTHMDHPDHIDKYIVEKKLGDYHIHMVHGYLTNKDMGDIFPHTTVDDIAKKTQADLTITGHDHIGFKLVEVDGKQFVNPGAVVRLTNDIKEIGRRPKVLIIDVSKDKGITVKTTYLKSAPKGEDVIDRSKITFKKDMSSKMEKIRSLVNKSNIGSGLNITDIIQAISESEKIDDELKDKAIEAVTKKMKDIQRQTSATQDYIIDKIVLENFQSHEYSEYELKQGLNVFIGKSSSGKSAIQRALAWIYENEGVNPRRYIRHGADYTRASIHLSNGFIISRFVEKKKHGKNGFEVFNPNDGETTFYNTRSLPLVQELLGFSYLQIDEKKSIPLNFQKQGMSWFFIGDAFSNTDRAKIIGAVYQTHYVDAVIKDLEVATKRHTSQIKDKRKEIESTEKEIAKFDHLPELEETIQEVEKRLTAIQLIQEKVEKAKEIMEERKRIEQQIKHDENLIQSLQNIPLAEKILSTLIEKAEQKKRITKLNADLEYYLTEIKKEQQSILSLKNIEQAEKRLYELESKVGAFQELKQKWERVSKLEREQVTTKSRIKVCEQVISSYKDLPFAESKLEQLEQKVQQVRKGEQLISELKEIIMLGKTERKTVQQVILENKGLVAKYQEVLNRVGTCPVCQSNVDNSTIEQISESYLLTEEKGRKKHVS